MNFAVFHRSWHRATMFLMPNPTPPLVARRLIGSTLKRLRQAKGLSLEDAAAACTMSFTAMARYESAKNAPKPPVLRELLELYDATDETTRELLKALSTASVPGWWSKFSGGLTVPDHLVNYAQLEQAAEEIRIYSVFVPGLLQARGYAEAILKDHSNRDQLVELRRRRQELFDRGVPVRVILDESALDRQVGGTDAWLDQIEFLISLARRPNVTLQILPYDQGEYGASVSGDFALLGLGDGDVVAYIENLSFGQFFEGAPVTEYRRAWERLAEYASSDSETLTVLRGLLHDERAVA